MKINLPKDVEFIINRIYENRREAFIVGGCVRDSILGINPNDYDITTNAKPNEIIDIFKGYKIINNGIKHGTVGVVIDKEVYEITTYRIESEYEDNRRPKEVRFTNSILEDLKRRDFTINSMAYNNKKGLIDEFNGIIDIHRGIVKTVGNADERFNEDGLRIIRAIRFSSKLGFEIDENTLKSIYINAKNVKNISKERITEEINKILLSKHPEKIELLYETKIFDNLGIYSEFKEENLIKLKNQLPILSECGETIEERLIMLDYLITLTQLSNIDSNQVDKVKCYKNNVYKENIVNTLRYSNYITNYCNNLTEYMFIDEKDMDNTKIKKIANKIGIDDLKILLNLKKIYYSKRNNENLGDKSIAIGKCLQTIETIEKNKECYNIRDLKINGDILIGLGYSGREVGEKLNYLLDEVIKYPLLNNKKDLINIIKQV